MVNGEAYPLKGGHTTVDRRLDRVPQFDPRSRQYSVKAVTPLRTPRSYSWAPGSVLDQGSEGACVGFGVTGDLSAKPVVIDGTTPAFAHRMYKLAQTMDAWPGEDYDGTSVLGGVKAAKHLGFYKEYRWAFSEEDLALAVGYHGPAIIGVNWYENMWDVDRAGFIYPEGNVLGGHCVLVFAVKVFGAQYYTIRNSWGPMWGAEVQIGEKWYPGCARISRTAMRKLLAEDGEACIPTIRSRPISEVWDA